MRGLGVMFLGGTGIISSACSRLAVERGIVHGDGTSLWTLTQHEDFARGFVPLTSRLAEAFRVRV